METTTSTEITSTPNADIIGVLLDKISRKGRLILIGIIAVVCIKRPEAITYASVAVYAIPIIAVTFLASLGTLSQHRLDMVTKVGKEGFIDLVKIKKEKPKPKKEVIVTPIDTELSDTDNRVIETVLNK